MICRSLMPLDRRLRIDRGGAHPIVAAAAAALVLIGGGIAAATELPAHVPASMSMISGCR